MMDDVERAVDDGVNAYKALARDGRLVPAGGAAEVAVAARLAAVARAETGLEQYAIAKFAAALEVVPRTLAENAGLNATDVLSALYAAHASGSSSAGVDIENGGVRDLGQDGLFDLFTTKQWAIRLACDAVTTVLRVDQIVMSRPAGGPKTQGPPGGDD
jgi:T-complex protein 1 subunit theta